MNLANLFWVLAVLEKIKIFLYTSFIKFQQMIIFNGLKYINSITICYLWTKKYDEETSSSSDEDEYDISAELQQQKRQQVS